MVVTYWAVVEFVHVTFAMMWLGGGMFTLGGSYYF